MTRSQARLLEVEADERPRWTGNVLPVRFEPGCPLGCGPLLRIVSAQLVLFIHGGYGAPRQTTHEVCPECFWSIERQVIEVNPRKV